MPKAQKAFALIILAALAVSPPLGAFPYVGVIEDYTRLEAYATI
jgi:hypothetical protein